MYITLEIMSVSEKTGYCIDLLHSIVRVYDDFRTQEQAKDHFLFQIFHKYVGDFYRSEGTASHVCFRSQGAVLAVIRASIGEKGFQKDGISSLRKCNRIKPFVVRSSLAAIVFIGATRTGQIVLRIFRQNFKLFNCVHGNYPQELYHRDTT